MVSVVREQVFCENVGTCGGVLGDSMSLMLKEFLEVLNEHEGDACTGSPGRDEVLVDNVAQCGVSVTCGVFVGFEGGVFRGSAWHGGWEISGSLMPSSARAV